MQVQYIWFIIWLLVATTNFVINMFTACVCNWDSECDIYKINLVWLKVIKMEYPVSTGFVAMACEISVKRNCVTRVLDIY